MHQTKSLHLRIKFSKQDRLCSLWPTILATGMRIQTWNKREHTSWSHIASSTTRSTYYWLMLKDFFRTTRGCHFNISSYKFSSCITKVEVGNRISFSRVTWVIWSSCWNCKINRLVFYLSSLLIICSQDLLAIKRADTDGLRIWL